MDSSYFIKFCSIFDPFCVPVKECQIQICEPPEKQNPRLLVLLEHDDRVENAKKNDSFCSNFAKIAACQNPCSAVQGEGVIDQGEYSTQRRNESALTIWNERSVFDTCLGTKESSEIIQSDSRVLTCDAMEQQQQSRTARSISKERQKGRPSTKPKSSHEQSQRSSTALSSPRRRAEVSFSKDLMACL